HLFVDFNRKNIPGMEKAVISASANLPGIRETRRITGDFVMSQEAFYASRHFEDDIACYDYPIDVHESKKSILMEDANIFEKAAEISRDASYGIPFRVMIPQGIGNLLVAGRSVSADRAMLGSLRVMPACFAMGQAAGTAAAIVSRQNISLCELKISQLRQKLQAAGCSLENNITN
ncbi:MAG: FAD-dependent oxidoreductase, partial [Victivallaceae bacterium]